MAGILKRKMAQSAAIMAEIKPWSEENQVPWSPKTIEGSAVLGVGNGEHKVCWELCQQYRLPFDPSSQVQGPSKHYDIELSELKKFEVKELDCRKSLRSQSIRIGSLGEERIRDFTDRLHLFVLFFETLERSSLGLPQEVRDLLGKTSEDKRISLRKDRFRHGSISQKDVDALFRTVKYVRQNWEDYDQVFWKMGGSSLRISQWKELLDGPSKFYPHDWLRDEWLVVEEWEKLQDVTQFFPSTIAGVAIVMKTGYCVINPDELNDFLTFWSISNGTVHLRPKTRET